MGYLVALSSILILTAFTTARVLNVEIEIPDFSAEELVIIDGIFQGGWCRHYAGKPSVLYLLKSANGGTAVPIDDCENCGSLSFEFRDSSKQTEKYRFVAINSVLETPLANHLIVANSTQTLKSYAALLDLGEYVEDPKRGLRSTMLVWEIRDELGEGFHLAEFNTDSFFLTSNSPNGAVLSLHEKVTGNAINISDVNIGGRVQGLYFDSVNGVLSVSKNMIRHWGGLIQDYFIEATSSGRLDLNRKRSRLAIGLWELQQYLQCGEHEILIVSEFFTDKTRVYKKAL